MDKLFRFLERAKPLVENGNDHSVEQVSWNDAQAFILKLNEKVKATGYQFKFPTEAQYEYAFRVGTTTAYVSGKTKSNLAEYVWSYENSGSRTEPLSRKCSNFWG